MANIILRPGWQGREQDVTPEAAYRNRRRFLKQMGLGTAALLTIGAPGCAGEAQRNGGVRPAAAPSGPLDTIPADAPRAGYPAPRNTAYTAPDRALTDRVDASSYNNFYEFKPWGEDLKNVWPVTGPYDPFPMTLEVDGLVEKPFTMDIAELITSMDLEERLYRFRCVEAWSMTVPWTGFPLRKLIERCRPLSKAAYVRFLSADRPEQMPGMALSLRQYKWPYYEALRMDEATNELAFVVTGMYGEPLPKQNGSPIRLALPWKYGYKGPKAVSRLEFVEQQPGTFWQDLQPAEYGFLSNVNPNIPHPRWTQASERVLGPDTRIPTQLFNGYEAYVAALYPDEPRQPTRPMAR